MNTQKKLRLKTQIHLFKQGLKVVSINDEFELKIYTLLENFRKEHIKIDAKLSVSKSAQDISFTANYFICYKIFIKRGSSHCLYKIKN